MAAQPVLKGPPAFMRCSAAEELYSLHAVARMGEGIFAR